MYSLGLCYFLLITSFQIITAEDVCKLITKDTDKIKNFSAKLCRYRDEGLMPYEIFKYRSGVGCYQYFPSNWFYERINIIQFNRKLSNYDCTFPIGRHNKKLLLFDYKDKNYSEIIGASFKDLKYFDYWKTCAANADACCNSTMDQHNIYSSTKYPCPTVWDAWSCFGMATVGSISQNVCPIYTHSSGITPCTLYSEKECFLNGTWNVQTKYSTCATAPIYRRRHSFHVIVLYISVVLSIPAVIIFTSYKNLRILRVNLHRNLLLACIVRNILTIITKEMIILDSLKPLSETRNVLIENGVACRILAYFNNLAGNAIYACMLADGFYLHKVIVRIFSEDPNTYILYGITAVLSFLPSTIWTIIVAIKSNKNCWIADSGWYQWIPDGFRLAILVINIILLADIVRVLLLKLRRNVNPQHTKSTLKVMSFLVPLFGIPFVVTASRDMVDNSSCISGDIYYYISYLIQAFQSVMVAVLFCYCSKEVHHQLKKTYRITANMCSKKYASIKLKGEASRRDTAATYVQNQSVLPYEQDIVATNTDVNTKVDTNRIAG